MLGFNPMANIRPEKNRAQTVPRDFKGRRAEGSLVMRIRQAGVVVHVNATAEIPLLAGNLYFPTIIQRLTQQSQQSGKKIDGIKSTKTIYLAYDPWYD